MIRDPALELAATIRHDGAGGVADDLAGTEGLAHWVADNADIIGGGVFLVDGGVRREVIEVRTALRTLLAHSVLPGPVSGADRGAPLADRAEAVRTLNAHAARVPVVPVLTWEPGAAPVPVLTEKEAGAGPDRLPAVLARAGIAFLTGPLRERLRACTAPRCVRYFIKEHNRQRWCKGSCGNRARVARHYAKTKAGG